jgi:hypothetical protein
MPYLQLNNCLLKQQKLNSIYIYSSNKNLSLRESSTYVLKQQQLKSKRIYYTLTYATKLNSKRI